VVKKLTACYLWCVGPVWDVKFSGADRVVTCGDDGTIRIWDSWSSHCIAVLSGHLDAVLSISLRQITGLCRFLKNLRLVTIGNQVLIPVNVSTKLFFNCKLLLYLLCLFVFALQ